MVEAEGQKTFGAFGVNRSTFTGGIQRFRAVVESVRLLIRAKYEAGKIESATEGQSIVRRLEKERILAALNDSYTKHGYVLLRLFPTAQEDAGRYTNGLTLKLANNNEFNGEGLGYTVVAGTPINTDPPPPPGPKPAIPTQETIYDRDPYHSDVYADEEFREQTKAEHEESGYTEAHSMVTSLAMNSEMALEQRETDVLRLIKRILHQHPPPESTQYVVRVRGETVTVTETQGFGSTDTKHGVLHVVKKDNLISFKVGHHTVTLNPTDNDQPDGSNTLPSKTYTSRRPSHQTMNLIETIHQYPEGGVEVGGLHLYTVGMTTGKVVCANRFHQTFTFDGIEPAAAEDEGVTATAWSAQAVKGLLLGPDFPSKPSVGKVGILSQRNQYECPESKLYHNTSNWHDARRTLLDYVYAEFRDIPPLEHPVPSLIESYTLLPTTPTSYPRSTAAGLPLLLQFGAIILPNNAGFQWSVGGACGNKVDALEAVVAYAHTTSAPAAPEEVKIPTADAWGVAQGFG